MGVRRTVPDPVPPGRRAAQTLTARDVQRRTLCGGSSFATALSLNACPYLATVVFPYRPWVEGVGVVLWRRQLL